MNEINLEEYTGLSKSNLYDKDSGNRRECIWKIGDLVQTPSNTRSKDSGCYGKIIDIEKEHSGDDSFWLCYYKILGPESSSQVGKIIGFRDYCFLPYSKVTNFSERLRKCFGIDGSEEPYTQTYEVSVSLDLSKHPEMNPKHHQADEDLPESLVDDLTSIGVKCNKSGFNDDRSKYTILEFDIERKPVDRYDDITKFITDKLVEYGFDENRIHITKWD